MIRVNEALKSIFNVPRVFFTLKKDTRSIGVLEVLQARIATMSESQQYGFDQEFKVFEDATEVANFFQGGVSPNSAVVLFDYSPRKSGRFSPTTKSRHNHKIPDWACGSQWGIQIGASCVSGGHQKNCADQLAVWFYRDFHARLDANKFPWGSPRSADRIPTNFTLPTMDNLLVRLNSGPNFAAAIASTEHAMELPVGSKISWLRVPPEPLICEESIMMQSMDAFEQFEHSCARLAEVNSDVRSMLLAGVDLPEDLQELYLNPSVSCFSVRRPDLHFTGDGFFASENDEMPGGFADAVLLDLAYGINQERWERCFRYLTSTGPLMFLVSHEWSKCYVPELLWLTDYLVKKGYPVHCLTTEQLDELSIRDDGVYYQGNRLGTIWRQFPIFEVKGKLAEIVRVAHDKKVRLVPEFSHFGNKTWFSLFRVHIEFFRKELAKDVFECLDRILPDSHLVRSEEDFPCTVGGVLVSSYDTLRMLPQEKRDAVVLKLSGANTLTARSYGVLMGHGLNDATWQAWLDERRSLKQPFIIQGRMQTDVFQMPVLNTQRMCGETFNCRLLLRPWMIGGEVVSISVCAVPSNTLRVHGRVDMALTSVVLE